MLPRNPSELQRLHEEALDDERNLLLKRMKSNILPKADKEVLLRRVYAIEQELGIVSQPYNSSEFGR